MMQVASRFTEALEADDWTTAGACLAADCVYVCRGSTFSGRDAVVQSYRNIGEWVRRTFDKVRYDSTLTLLDSGQVRADFRDRIDHGEQHLDFRCYQIWTGSDGVIHQIEHHDLPGMNERAVAFNEACGVVRPG